MSKTRTLFGTSLFVLAALAGLMVWTGCEQSADEVDNTTPPISICEVADYLDNATEDGTPDDPIPLSVQIDITNDWRSLLSTIQRKGKYVALDLSGCTSNTTFDPGMGNIGVGYIVSLVLPNAATGIKAGDYSNPTFKNFTVLKSVSGENVQSVGTYAFYECSGLTSVDLPAATSIGGAAFFDCTGLTCVDLPATLTSIDTGAFKGCTSLSAFTVAPDNLNYKHSDDNKMLLSKDGTTIVSYPTAAGTVTLNTIITIGHSAFHGCTGLASVALPKATTIDDEAFIGCRGLTSVDSRRQQPSATAPSITAAPYTAAPV